MNARFLPFVLIIVAYRVKLSLRNGDFAVSGDQWPLLVYKDYVYDPENPWAGVFRSSILIKVSRHHQLVYLFHIVNATKSRTNISSLPQVQQNRK